ncbi:MAG: hypothetical protein ACK5LT_14040 [Lachnospirales bacterium]
MKLIDNFLQAKINLYDYFAMDYNYDIRINNNIKWKVEDSEGTSFLTYWINNEKFTNLIVKKDEPLIVEKSQYTMVIAIDCVKIAYVFNNAYKIQ